MNRPSMADVQPNKKVVDRSFAAFLSSATIYNRYNNSNALLITP